MPEKLSKPQMPIYLHICALSESQREALMFHAFGGEGNCAASSDDYRILEGLGLLERYEFSQQWEGFGEFKTWEYDVPWSVHHALCVWCSEQEDSTNA